MNSRERLDGVLQSLPEHSVAEVLDFAQFLHAEKTARRGRSSAESNLRKLIATTSRTTAPMTSSRNSSHEAGRRGFDRPATGWAVL